MVKKNRLPVAKLALEPDAAAVQLDELARDREAEPRAVVLRATPLESTCANSRKISS